MTGSGVADRAVTLVTAAVLICTVAAFDYGQMRLSDCRIQCIAQSRKGPVGIKGAVPLRGQDTAANGRDYALIAVADMYAIVWITYMSALGILARCAIAVIYCNTSNISADLPLHAAHVQP